MSILLIGPAIPIPVSQEVLDALTNVQVISSTDDKMNGFELTFMLTSSGYSVSPLRRLSDSVYLSRDCGHERTD